MAFGDAGRAFGYAVRTHRISAALLGLALSITLVVSLIPNGSAGAAANDPPSVLIPSGGAYFGARVGPRGSESQQDAVLRVESQVGRRFAIDHYYYQWNDNFPGSAQSWTVSQGRIPFINWRAGGSWSAIANGSQDQAIIARADAIKNFGYPLYLTFHHEPENDLDTYGTAGDYAAAIRHIVDVFRARGVRNVAWVWTMMAWTMNSRSGRDAASYWPGDAYIDLVGADGYNWYPGRAGDKWVEFQEIFDPVNAFAAAHNKPWMVVEYGAQEDPAVSGRKGQWIKNVLQAAKGWPSLKALIYFDMTKLYPWDTDSSSSSMAAYRQIAQDPYLNPGGSVTPPPSPSPTQQPPTPSPTPTSTPSPTQTSTPTPSPSPTQTSTPTPSPSPSPTQTQTSTPTPSPSPTQSPTPQPTPQPTPAPSAVLANTLNGGVLGASLAGSNSGGSSGAAFDGVAIEGGASLVYDNTHTRGAGLAARHTVGPRQNAFYKWDRSFSNWAISYGRVYVWFDRLPSGDLRLVRGKDGSGNLSFALDLLKDGRLRAKDRANKTIAQTWSQILTGGWVRIEWRVDAITGQIDLRIFNSPNSTTATDAATSGPGRAISVPTEVQIGRSGTQPFSVTFWTDDPAIGSSGYLGPVA